MDSKSGEIRQIAVGRIYLNESNARHEPKASQSEAIQQLCKRENIKELAGDIAKHGTNPLELFALFPDRSGKKGKKDNFVVAEGNRRLCAIKLLNDPELAPPEQRDAFERLAKTWTPVQEVQAIVFDTKEEMDLWIDRIHGGLQGGIGRKNWDAEQKTRHAGDKRNLLAQQVLDYAEKHKFITPEQRKRKLTTVQRYVTNPLLRNTLGLVSGNPEELQITRPTEDFNLLLSAFMSGVVSGDVSSRKGRDEIEQYARELEQTEGLKGGRNDPAPIEAGDSTKARAPRKVRPRTPTPPKRLHYDPDLARVIKKIPSYKLEKLYYSICSIELREHTPLLTVAVWSLVESLTHLAGRQSGTDFISYLNVQRLNNLGLGSKEQTKTVRAAIGRVSASGNTTKHDRTAAGFDSDQLANDFELITPVLLKLAESAKSGNSP